MRVAMLPLAAALSGMLVSGAAFAADGIQVNKSSDYGSYITDSAGKALYLFTSDTQGKGGSEAKSACAEKCLDAWPPFAVPGKPDAGDGVKADMIGTTKRSDGTTQATYNGWPLYYFVKDVKADEPQGQDKHGFGGEWYLITPSGEKVHE